MEVVKGKSELMAKITGSNENCTFDYVELAFPDNSTYGKTGIWGNIWQTTKDYPVFNFICEYNKKRNNN